MPNTNVFGLDPSGKPHQSNNTRRNSEQEKELSEFWGDNRNTKNGSIPVRNAAPTQNATRKASPTATATRKAAAPTATATRRAAAPTATATRRASAPAATSTRKAAPAAATQKAQSSIPNTSNSDSGWITPKPRKGRQQRPTPAPGELERRMENDNLIPKGRSRMVNSDNKYTDVALTKHRQMAFYDCLNNTDRDTYGLTGVTYRKKMTEPELQALHRYLKENDKFFPNNFFSYETMEAASQVLCRWPRPSEMARLSQIFHLGIDTSYFTGMMSVGGSDIALLVGTQAENFSAITEKYNLLYMWMSPIPRTRRNQDYHHWIFAYGKEQGSVIAALQDLYTKVEDAGYDVKMKADNRVLLAKRNMYHKDTPFGEEEFDKSVDLEDPGLAIIDLKSGHLNADDDAVSNYLDDLPNRLPAFAQRHRRHISKGKEIRKKTHRKDKAVKEGKASKDCIAEKAQYFKEFENLTNKQATEKAIKQCNDPRMQQRIRNPKTNRMSTPKEQYNSLYGPQAGRLNAIREREENAAQTQRQAQRQTRRPQPTLNPNARPFVQPTQNQQPTNRSMRPNARIFTPRYPTIGQADRLEQQTRASERTAARTTRSNRGQPNKLTT